MGLETVAQAGLGLVQNSQIERNAKAQADATVQSGAIEASNLSRETQLRAGSQTARFLNSGFTLAGTPQADAAGTYATGAADVNQSIANTNAKSANIYSAARTQMLNNLLQSSKGLGLGGLDLAKTASSAFDPGSTFNPISWNTAAGLTEDTGASASVLWNV